LHRPGDRLLRGGCALAPALAAGLIDKESLRAAWSAYDRVMPGTTPARLVLDPAFRVADVDERVFGSFVEHMGRAVYGGIFEPGHPTAGADGFRGDVLELVRGLGVTIVRYPGGNFVSGYDWEDGVGPAREARLDLAWRSLETNQVGTNEFLAWARRAGAEPMLAVNMGTRGVDAARALVEYCNIAGGSRWAELRRSHGVQEPWGVRVWCVGNEMDGPWQLGAKDAVAYGKLANEAGKAMRLVDPGIELVMCGSSNSAMPTFGAWEDTVLDLTWEVADHISLHTYYDPASFRSIEAFLACSRDLDRMIGTVAATADAVAGRRRSHRRISLSVDEWNVWYQSARSHRRGADVGFDIAPPIVEDTYTVTDALVVGCLLITLLRNADRVRMACLAQLVNVIPPIRTLDGGPAWRQTTYHPFAHASRYGRGTVLRVEVDAPAYEVPDEGPVPVLEATAVASDTGMTLFAVNRAEHELPLEAVLRGSFSVAEQLVLADEDPAAANTATDPDRVVPLAVTGARVDGELLHATLPPRSWNVIRLAGAA
jgi:alpha-N-arabinofuranosidase